MTKQEEKRKLLEQVGRKLCFLMLRSPEELVDFSLNLIKGEFKPLLKKEL